jgi:hypothetical protein
MVMGWCLMSHLAINEAEVGTQSAVGNDRNSRHRGGTVIMRKGRGAGAERDLAPVEKEDRTN